MTRPEGADATALGFGCASLFGLPTKRERRVVLEAAYELGIRHFDVAPIYGLGVAEAELADFMKGRDDIRVATKFGIKPTTLGRVAGFSQAPIRRLLKRSSSIKAGVKTSGQSPNAGVVGRVLYSRPGYSTDLARKALAASKRALKLDRLDYFLLHEPADAPDDDYRPLIDFLEGQRGKGSIGGWGPAGDLSSMGANLGGLCGAAQVRQLPYTLMSGHRGPSPEEDSHTIAYGFVATALPYVCSLLASNPDLRRQCNDLLDADLADERIVVRLLVRDALASNRSGTVLVSSTKLPNLRLMSQAATVPLRNEAEVTATIKQNCRTFEIQ